MKIGIWETVMVKKDPETEIFKGPEYSFYEVTRKCIPRSEKRNTIWKNEIWKETDRKYYIEDDWFSPHFCFLLEKLNKESPENKIELSKRMLKLFDKTWDIYKIQ